MIQGPADVKFVAIGGPDNHRDLMIDSIRPGHFLLTASSISIE
jgi:hypothetical protein